jgi:hypothetical protein
VEHHLQQQVAEFLAEVVGVVLVDRVEQLIGLLDQVPGEGGVGLLQVPRAAARATQARLGHHQVEQGRAFRFAQRVDGLHFDVLAGGPVGDELHQRAVVARRQQQGGAPLPLGHVEQGVGTAPRLGHPLGVEPLPHQQQVAACRAGVGGRREHRPRDLTDVQGRQ